MVATREAEAKPHLRQGTWRVRAHALVVTALRLMQVPSHTRLFSLLRTSASTQELLGSLREEQGGSGTSGGSWQRCGDRVGGTVPSPAASAQAQAIGKTALGTSLLTG